MKLPSFKRNQSESTLPVEIEEYYQSERRERTGVAWLLAGGTLILTLVLAFGLYFGGKWVYQKVANRDQNETAETNSADVSDASDAKTSDDDQTGTSSTTTAPAPATPPAPAPTTPTTGSAVAPATPSNRIPNTGPSEE